MATERELELAEFRRKVSAIAESMSGPDGIDHRGGWRMEAKPLRESLRKIAVSYPAVSDAEFGDLINVVQSMIWMLKPPK